MRQYTTILALLVALSAVAEGQVTWLRTVHDFGAFDEDTNKKTAVFSFVNTTDEPVTIISATATCGCTTPTYDTSAIAPGDTATIQVSYDPSGRPGRFEKQIYIRTSDSYDRTKLLIKGTVIGNPETINSRYPVSMGPLKLRTGAAMMGKAMAGHAKMHYIDGYNMSADSITPVVVAAPAWIEATAVPERVGPGEMLSFDLYFRGDLCQQWGVVTDSIMIRPSATEQAYALPLIVVVEEDFSKLTPEQRQSAPQASLGTDRVDIGPIAEHSDKPVTATVKLTNRGVDPLKVRRVYSEDPGMTVTLTADEIQKNKSADIQISFNPAVQPTGIINARVTVITNDPFNPTQVIRVVGERSSF